MHSTSKIMGICRKKEGIWLGSCNKEQGEHTSLKICIPWVIQFGTLKSETSNTGYQVCNWIFKPRIGEKSEGWGHTFRVCTRNSSFFFCRLTSTVISLLPSSLTLFVDLSFSYSQLILFGWNYTTLSSRVGLDLLNHPINPTIWLWWPVCRWERPSWSPWESDLTLLVQLLGKRNFLFPFAYWA